MEIISQAAQGENNRPGVAVKVLVLSFHEGYPAPMKTATARLFLDKRRVRIRRARAQLSGAQMCESLVNRGKRPSLSAWFTWETAQRPIPEPVLRQVCKLLACRKASILK